METIHYTMFNVTCRPAVSGRLRPRLGRTRIRRPPDRAADDSSEPARTCGKSRRPSASRNRLRRYSLTSANWRNISRRLRKFTFALDLRGTDFQVACWHALLAIPYGETRTYADIARAVGRPQGFRAVGMANNRNPIAIVVPCHRVIASDGTLCGYGGGLDLKRKLLELEGALQAASSLVAE